MDDASNNGDGKSMGYEEVSVALLLLLAGFRVGGIAVTAESIGSVVVGESSPLDGGVEKTCIHLCRLPLVATIKSLVAVGRLLVR
jgi:hypothetical protein